MIKWYKRPENKRHPRGAGGRDARARGSPAGANLIKSSRAVPPYIPLSGALMCALFRAEGRDVCRETFDERGVLFREHDLSRDLLGAL